MKGCLPNLPLIRHAPLKTCDTKRIMQFCILFQTIRHFSSLQIPFPLVASDSRHTADQSAAACSFTTVHSDIAPFKRHILTAFDNRIGAMPGYGARNQIAYQSGRLSFNDHIRRRLNHNASMSSLISQPDNTFHSFYLFKKFTYHIKK